MSFTLRTSGTQQTTGTTVAVTLSGIVAGDLICAALGGDSGAATVNSFSDGTSSLTGGTINTGINKYTQFYYLLSSVASGSVTYTATWAASQFGYLTVYAFTPSGTASFDVQNAVGSGNSTSAASGNITTTGTDELVFGTSNTDAVVTYSAQSINALAATGTAGTANGNGAQSLWYRAFASTFTGNITATLSGTGSWQANAIAFINSGGGGASVPLLGQACL